MILKLIRRFKRIMTGKAKLKELKNFDTTGNLAEIYQKTGIHFAFVSKDDELCHEWVKCRDFLHDAVKTEITGKLSKIYGFSFQKDINPHIDLKRIRIAATKKGPQDGVENKFNASLRIVNHYEKYAGMVLSTMKEVTTSGKGKPRVFLFVGSPTWVRSPFMVSMYTFLIRLGDKELNFKNAYELKQIMKTLSEGNVGNDNDLKYLSSLWSILHKIIKRRKDMFKLKDSFHDIYFEDHPIQIFHNFCGILSLATAGTPNAALNDFIRKEIQAK